MDTPRTRYAVTADGANIAYSTCGVGPIDILVVHPWLSHLEVYWEWPGYGRFIRGLADGARVILFDKRGVGLSDPIVRTPDLETRMEDAHAVLDAVGSTRTSIFGWGEGAALAAMFAATYPDRCAALILYSPHMRMRPAPDFPWADDEETFLRRDDAMIDAWGDESRAEVFLREGCAIDDPADLRDEDLRRWSAKLQRYACSPGAFRTYERVFLETDARGVLPSIHVPTLVLSQDPPDERPADEHSSDWPVAQDVASRIAGARLEGLGRRHWVVWMGDAEEFGRRTHAFLEPLRREEAELDRILATVLFTDVVDSTATAAVMGDEKWRELLAEHDRIAKGLIGRYRGTYQKSTGDGLMATFDGPARAVRCAQAFVEAVKPLGIEVRTGAHTGEVTFGDNDLTGIGVHVAARVAALAGTSEVWASSTVKDLTAGSGLTYEDAGEHELKGVPDRWHLYRVTA